MNKVIFFIDGFNLYHALNGNPLYHKYKWLDLTKLVKCYIKENEKIESIYYFTALAYWRPDKIARHKLFIKALELQNINIVYGKFKIRDKTCRLCKGEYRIPEEKQTDVNIAIHLFELAMYDRYDTAIIISGDSDFAPSIQAVKKNFPIKRIGIVIPIGRGAEFLKQICDFHMKMKEKHLRSSLFEKEIAIGEGRKLICPPQWQ